MQLFSWSRWHVVFNNQVGHLYKFEAQLSAIKSHVNFEVSILTNNIESISNDFEKRMNILLGKENSN